MDRQPRAHYLRRNHSEWTPPALVSLDTETRPVGGDTDIQTMRCWVASIVERPEGMTDWESVATGAGKDAASLVNVIEGWSKRNSTLWIYAHNLAFDLTVTRLPILLAERGWQITDFAIDGRSPWIRLRNGRRHITMADSWSWIPKALEVIGGAIGESKVELPKVEDSDDQWYARCAQDVHILLTAMGQLMDWWSLSGRGRWSVTGAASGWNAMRHTHNPYRIVIDLDKEGVANDRGAIYGGKRWVNRVGKQSPGRHIEADFARAYTTVARDMPLPIRRCRPFSTLDINDARLSGDRWGVIARVTLRTDRPRYPKRDVGRVWYPVGTFQTVLASPEIVRARELGHLVSIEDGYTYQLAPALRNWATWCMELIDDDSADVPELARMVARAWGRSVIGKFAQHGYAKVELGPAPTLGWGYEEAWIAGAHTRASIVDLAGQRYLCHPEGDGENAFPAVLAFVESHVRVALNDAIEAIGNDAFVQCDTDGVLVSAVDLVKAARKAETRLIAKDRGIDIVDVILEAISRITAPLTMRRKASYQRVDVIGPQHVVLDGHRRFAGMPSRMTELPDGRLGAWQWPKMPYQLAHGDPRGFVRHYARYRVPSNLAGGWVTVAGHVLPVEYERNGDGSDHPVPWGRSRYAGRHALRAEQPKAISALFGNDGMG